MRLIDADELLKVTVKRNSIWNAITNSSGEGLEEIINNQPTIEIHKWIPVSERLPDMDKYVLCSVNKLYETDLEVIIAIAQFRNEGWWTNGRIKAWMPLPEPYKADKGVEE